MDRRLQQYRKEGLLIDVNSDLIETEVVDFPEINYPGNIAPELIEEEREGKCRLQCLLYCSHQMTHKNSLPLRQR